MKRPYQITAVVFILFAAFIARDSMELKFYTALGPGPSFFPFWLSVLMMILAAMMFFNATFKNAGPMPDDFWASKVGYLRMLAIFLAISFAVFFMETIGFRLTMLAFYLFLLFALGRQNLIVTAIVAIAGSWGVFQVFTEYLKVPLPIGIFGI
ncbi:MAG TPA: tripartite tricarboxylate transporter TctB family protein [Chloroflexota bacterium]|nr:tripartite tricarboxylate transporter TctB family protein [Chloroflexota bacterium]